VPFFHFRASNRGFRLDEKRRIAAFSLSQFLRRTDDRLRKGPRVRILFPPLAGRTHA
jgi:hypothetical protein